MGGGLSMSIRSYISAWLTFLVWYLGILFEPWFSSLRNAWDGLSFRVKVFLIRSLRGNYYPFYLLNTKVQDALGEWGIERPTPIQVLGIPRILRGENVLLMAPTGSGKTECALLPILHKLSTERLSAYGIYVLYITPLRALCSDIAKRIEGYVHEVLNFPYDAVAWHSDVGRDVKESVKGYPPTILVTTPESLEKILDTEDEVCRHLRNLRFIIIDEVHELVDSKRGHQLLILLERLKASLGIKRLQRILISATVADPKRIARIFSGSDGKIKVIRDPSVRRMNVELVLCSEDTAKVVAESLREMVAGGSYLIFVNTRAEAEHLHAELEALGVDDLYVHHSAVSSKEKREVEGRFKQGNIKGIVCTRTLELGIDIGCVRRVLQVGSPSLPECLAQRLGRSSHRPGEVAGGSVLCLDVADLLEVIALLSLLSRGRLCGSKAPPLYLDVVAREIIGFALQHAKCECMSLGVNDLETIYDVVTKAYPYRFISMEVFRSLLEYLSRRELIKMSEGAIILNDDGFNSIWGKKNYPKFFSLIPERHYLTVRHGWNELGYIDLVNLRFLREGSVIRLGGRCWRVKRVKLPDVFVEPGEWERFAIPIWRGGFLLTPQAVGLELYRILYLALKRRRKFGEGFPSAVRLGLITLSMGEDTGRGLSELIEELIHLGPQLPSPKKIIVEKLPLRGQMAITSFLHSKEQYASSGVTIILYPFGEYVANTLASALWRCKEVFKVVPKCYGILVKHTPGFDPLKYILGLSRKDLYEAVGGSPYIDVVAYEMRRSFGYKSVKQALEEEFFRGECIRQVLGKFYDVEATLKLTSWIKHGCIKVIYRSPLKAEDLHPLSKVLFRAQKYFS